MKASAERDTKASAERDTKASAERLLDRLSAEVRHLVLRQVRLVDRATEDLERLEAHEFTIADLRRAIAADSTGRIGAIAAEALSRARRARRAARAAIWTAPPQQPASKVEMLPKANGGVAVRVERGQWIALSPALGNLLRVLERAPGDSDGLSEWQSFDTVSTALARKGARKATRHAVVQLVYRLRRLLARGGADPRLVQVDRRKGLRFFVKKSALGLGD